MTTKLKCPFRRFPSLGFVLFLVSCNQPDRADLAGLYQLSALNVDGWNRAIQPELLELKSDGSFAISKISGDDVGFYQLDGSKIKFTSESGGRFNAKWRVVKTTGALVMKGLDDGYTVTKMTFEPISEVPRFDQFEDELIGSWQIYKSRQKGKMKRIAGTTIKIDSSGEYAIYLNNELMESGKAQVNTRHHKLMFEYEDTQWNAWFYGEELRLTNPETGFQYDLKRVN